MRNTPYKVVSIMKYSRENSSSQLNRVQKENLVRTLAWLGATHIDLTMFAATNADLIAHGFTPSPLSIENETKEWYDVIMAQPNVYGSSVYGGFLQVMDRCVFPQAGDDQGAIFGYSIETATAIGTAATADADGYTKWVGRYKKYLTVQVGIERLRNGYIGCPFPEIDARAFTGSYFSNQSGAHTFAIECHKVFNELMASVGKTGLFLNNVNFAQANSGWWSGHNDTGINCIDYYGRARGSTRNQPIDYIQEFLMMYAGQNVNGGSNGLAGKEIFIGEFGDIPGEAIPRFGSIEEIMRFHIQLYSGLRDQLINPGKMIGLGIWGGWNSQNTSILYRVGDEWFPNVRGRILREFWVNDGMDRVPTVTAGTFADGLGGRDMRY